MRTLYSLFLTAFAVFLWCAVAFGETMVVPPILPDPLRTPGDIDDAATMEKVCLSGYTGSVRSVSDKNRRQVFSFYNINPANGKFEVDHLISLELGGSNDVKNLWPQSYTTVPWNAHVKDKLENRLHREICDGIITITEAQEAIRTDWIKTYCDKYDDMQEECASYLKENKNEN